MTLKRILCGAVAALLLAVVTTPATAATLQIQFSGLNLVYSGDSTGGLVCDAVSCGGGSGSPADSDPLISMVFLVDGALLGSLSQTWADIALILDAGLPSGGGTVSGSGFIFDLLMKNQDFGAWGLAINAGTFNVNYNPAVNTFAFTGSGVVGNGIFNQDLPFGLVIGDPVIWSFSTNSLQPATVTDGFVSSFDSSGTGEVSGVVPEPASLLLMGSGLTALAGMVRRRRKA